MPSSIAQTPWLRCRAGSPQFVLLFSLALSMLPCQDVTGAENEDEMLVKNRGVVITVKDATGVSYRDALVIIDRIERSVPGSRKNDPALQSLFAPPAVAPWKPAENQGLRHYYNHLLNGVARVYIQSRVYEAFIAEHPDCTSSDRLRLANVDQYIEAEAGRRELIDRGARMWVSGTIEADAFKRMVSDKYPRIQLTDQDLQILQSDKRKLFVTSECCPVLSNGRIAAWKRWEVQSILIDYFIQFEIDRDPDRFIALATEATFGRRYLRIDNRTDVDADTLMRLLSELMDENGKVAVADLEKANAVFRDLGCRIRLFVEELSPTDLAIRYGITTSVPLGKVVTATSRGKLSDTKTALFSAQTLARRRLPDLGLTPGHLVFSVGKDVLLGSVVERVLSGMEFGPSITVPTASDVAGETGGAVLLGQKPAAIDPLPQVIVKEIR